MTKRQANQIRGFSTNKYYWDDLYQARWLRLETRHYPWHNPSPMENVYQPSAWRIWGPLIRPLRERGAA